MKEELITISNKLKDLMQELVGMENSNDKATDHINWAADAIEEAITNVNTAANLSDN